ncbi:MAG: putative regulatory protein, FmdB family, partial [Acidobacteria bacterium]|nr:putative regulatory protein, FmdB family [Acidobacteriota bacterium]
MPLYEYTCEACGRRFEVIRKFSDPPLDVCTLCGSGPVNRLPSSPAIQFKGSGFYITDYARKEEGGRRKEEGAGEGKSDKTSTEQTQDAKSDAAAADKAGKTDTAAKTEGKSETAAKTETAAKADAPAKSDAPAKPSGSSSTTSGGSKD